MKTILNGHLYEVKAEFTLEFDVKLNGCCNKQVDVTEEKLEYEQETGEFIGVYSDKCFKDIQQLGYKWIIGYTFTGRSGGWFTLLCGGKLPYRISNNQHKKISDIVLKYLNNYPTKLENYYNN